MAAAKKEVAERLDRVDKMPVGSGHLDLTAYLRGDLLSHRAGVAVDYEHRVRKNLSIFAEAWGGTNWARDTGYDLDYGALGGLRWSF